MKNTWKYKEYSFTLHYKPKKEDVHAHLLSVNDNKLKYGLFSDEISSSEIDFFYERTLVCLLFYEDEPIGFYYFYILDESIPLVHLGLIVIKNNRGHDIGYIAQKYGMLFLSNKFKNNFYITTITTVPRVVEYIDDNFTDVWPSPRTNLARSPHIYRNFLKTLEDKYVIKYFPDSDKITINHRRFILYLQKRETGFDDDFHKLSKASKFEYNSFCQTWLNYDLEEDLILMGRLSFKSRLKLLIFYFKTSFFGVVK